MSQDEIPNRACKGCPWRTENHNRPPFQELPKGFVHEPGDQVYLDWYGPDNRRRLWEGLREGETMSCHATDSRMWEKLTQKSVQPCLGQMYLVSTELQLFEEVLKTNESLSAAKKYKLYRDRSKNPMTQMGLYRWAEKITFPAIFGGVADKVPKSMVAEDYSIGEDAL